MKLGLDAVTALFDGLGRPLAGIPTILVTGTNGKGSTAAFAAALLSAAGVKTLLYTSPHVASVRERIRIGQRPITAAALARRLEEVRLGIRRLRRRGVLPHHPTFFEVLTAAAFLHGRAARVEAAVLEVGLGGRHDATNIMPADVAVITGVGIDHARHLGDTPARIAWNKAGIIKKGEIVVTGVRARAPMQVIARRARARGARLIRVSGQAATRRDDGRWDLDLDAAARLRGSAPHGRDPAGRAGREAPRPAARRRHMPPALTAARLGLAGRYQGGNALLALTAVAALARLRFAGPHVFAPGSRSGGALGLGTATLRRGLAAASLPGRFEIRRAARNRRVVLDGAHNPGAVAQLVRSLADVTEDPVTLVFGVLADKDIGGMVRPLFRRAAHVLLCRPPRRRAAEPATLLPLLPERPRASIVPDPLAALNTALALTPAGGTVLVTGSFSLLGAVAPRTSRLPLWQRRR